MPRAKKEQPSASITWKDEEEYFTFIAHRFNIQAAKKILREKPRKIDTLDVEGASGLLSKEKRDADGKLVSLTLGIGVDWQRVDTDATIDPEVPIILVPFQDSVLPIDGWHRIAKAHREGRKQIPCVILTSAETKRVRC